jgi:alpha-tubulin suppressor-like RCC1 family protein
MQEVEQDKLRFEIGKVLNGVIGESRVWGWGNNKWGQLGLYGGNNFPEPKLIPIPELLKPGNYITSVECGKRHSAFITSLGEVYITGNYVPEKIQTS